jgi:hypothetical protein
MRHCDLGPWGSGLTSFCLIHPGVGMVLSATFVCTGFSEVPWWGCFVPSGMNVPLREKACGSNSSVLNSAAPLSSPP